MKQLSPPATYPYRSKYNHYAVVDCNPATVQQSLQAARTFKDSDTDGVVAFFTSESCRSLLDSSSFIDRLVILPAEGLEGAISRLRAERSWTQFYQPNPQPNDRSTALVRAASNIFGIAIFFNAGDILNATMVAHQLKKDDPTCYIVWYTAQNYEYILKNNPYIDEIIALPGDPKTLGNQIESLKSQRNWTKFLTPAPYLQWDKAFGEPTLADLIRLGAGMELTVPFTPIFRLTEDERQEAQNYWNSLPQGCKILVETEFRSQQSIWTDDYAFDLLASLQDLNPVFIFTAKHKPPFFDRFADRYPKIIWCDRPFRLNAEFLNLCDAFIGVASGISCLASSDYCRKDLRRIEVSRGEHWSFASYKQNLDNLRVCFSRARFKDALKSLAIELSGVRGQAIFAPRFATLAKLSETAERIACTNCGSTECVTVRGQDIVQCKSCHTIYLRERPTPDALENYHKLASANSNQSAFPYTICVPSSVAGLDSNPTAIAAQHRDVLAKIASLYGANLNGKTIVDIGCGWGAFLHHAKQQGLNPIGFELNQHNVQFGKHQLGLDIRQQQFLDAEIPESAIDIVFISHTLNLVPYPFELLEKVHYVLKRGGLVYCIVPNIASLCSQSLGEQWAWNDRLHYSYYTPRALRETFLQVGLTVESSHTITGDYGEDTPLAVLAQLYPDRTAQQYAAMLQEINHRGQGEELHIIGRKTGNSQPRLLSCVPQNLPQASSDDLAACYQTIKLNPNSAEAYKQLGNLLQSRGQSDAAIRAYHRSIAIDPDFAEAYANLGNIAYQQGNLDEAIARYQQAISLKPNVSGFYGNLSRILHQQGRVHEAHIYQQKASDLQVNHRGA